MKSATASGRQEEALPSADANLRVVVVYEDNDSGLRAKFAVDRVLKRLPANGACSLGLWPFELLDLPSFLEEAVQAAVAADIIMISLRGDLPLPPAVQNWVGRWLEQPERRRQCLALLLGMRHFGPQPMAISRFLSRRARRGGVDMVLGFAQGHSIFRKRTLAAQDAVAAFSSRATAVRDLHRYEHAA